MQNMLPDERAKCDCQQAKALWSTQNTGEPPFHACVTLQPQVASLSLHIGLGSSRGPTAFKNKYKMHNLVFPNEKEGKFIEANLASFAPLWETTKEHIAGSSIEINNTNNRQ